LKNRSFGGYVISTLAKLAEMLGRFDLDLRLKFGPLSALKCVESSFWGLTPKPEVVLPKFLVPFCRG